MSNEDSKTLMDEILMSGKRKFTQSAIVKLKKLMNFVNHTRIS
ncbi:MAG: hypothetical protein ACLRX1_05555 [Ruminococcus sp.]